jgi:3-hydroxyisobutyrate dehydrogenase
VVAESSIARRSGRSHGMSTIHEQAEERNLSQSMQTQEMVAVLGVGTMGHGMVESALRADIPAIVWDRNPERARELAGLGAHVADTATEAVARAGIVVTMVPDTDAVISIATDQGMLDALAPDSIWVQMSTIGLAGIDRVADLVESRRHDITLLDAPVSGSKEPAEHGELTIFASGP